MCQANKKTRNTPTDPEPRQFIDPEEFVAHYEDAYSELALLAAAIIGDRVQAEDIVQEASIIAIQKLNHFQPGTSLKAWLAEIVRRCSFNYRRKTQNRKTFAADPTNLGQITKDSSTNSGSWPIKEQSGELVDDQSAFDDTVLHALSGLSEDARCCLLLRIVQKLSYAEIAELMQLPEGTAMSHVHRSKATLRRILSAKENRSEP